MTTGSGESVLVIERSAHWTVVVAVADRSRASDWVVVVAAVAVFDRLAQPVTVPVTVIVTEAPAASEPRAHGKVSLVSQVGVPGEASMLTPLRPPEGVGDRGVGRRGGAVVGDHDRVGQGVAADDRVGRVGLGDVEIGALDGRRRGGRQVQGVRLGRRRGGGRGVRQVGAAGDRAGHGDRDRGAGGERAEGAREGLARLAGGCPGRSLDVDPAEAAGRVSATEVSAAAAVPLLVTTIV